MFDQFVRFTIPESYGLLDDEQWAYLNRIDFDLDEDGEIITKTKDDKETEGEGDEG